MPLGTRVTKRRRRVNPPRRRATSGLTPRSREALGSVLVVAGIFMIISLVVRGGEAAGDTGLIGNICARTLGAFAGGGSWAIAVSFILIGLAFMLESSPFAFARRCGGILVLALLSVVFLELALPGSGGVWGAIAASAIIPFVGRIGGYIFLVLIWLISAAVMLDSSPGGFVRGIAKGGARALGTGYRWLRITASSLRRLLARAVLPLFEEREKESASPEMEPVVPSPQLPDGKLKVVGAALPHTQEHAQEHDGGPGCAPPQRGKGKGEARSVSPPVIVAPAGSGIYSLPVTDMLKYIPAKRQPKSSTDLVARARLLEETLESFGVHGQVLQVSCGPVVTRYEFHPGPGITVSKITSLANDIALALAAAGVRIEAPIPGKSAVGIEVPNEEPIFVSLREVIESPAFQKSPSKLTIAFGKDIAGNVVTGDLKQMLHLLVAGATGSGKSVCLNCLIASILFKARPEEVKLLMIDPKRVELSTYDGIPHLLAPVVTDTREAAGYLRWVAEEMDRRYKLLERAGVRNIEKYNELCLEGKAPKPEPDSEDEEDLGKPLPYIVVIIDELGDLMLVAQKEVEDVISQLAFMARAAGIHLVVATQRPSRDVVTGIIKMNIPSRVAFAVPAGVDSRVILDTNGAERLLGKGDMLFFPIGAPKPQRVQGAYVSDPEIEALVKFVRSQGEPNYEAKCLMAEPGEDAGENLGEEDSLFDEACRLIIETQEASISKLQRRFRIGYSRAARLIDAMEQRGIVGPYEGSKPRKVLVGQERFGRQDGGRRI